ncbi:putative small-conductance mechanosensitive channel [Phaeobacter inhibens]|uniref:Small-conductance mechanosensitive channel n=1 Tax=Phaeobacter inhibens TaxID=221822 RepID=A0ABN5GIC8_9RHOB|nr:mechanosensitive ion channel family protein [Phaeobacter inhibens]AUQ48728.1 putative small-conductance mechanosensitive channel [Phaeobacter inhibens]AUQ93228.1 putative small-conductance mechanosensitive channel [Phaeobacter inhibens]AUR18531.1 putative small-conductance mechanosensitive channel [Phaeobacter inhibens]
MDSMNALMETEIYNGKSLADLVTLEFLAQAMGSVLAAIMILLAGFIVASWVRRRIVQIGDSHASLDVTLFHFLGNLARYVILAFAVLFVLNTFGVQTTSIIAAIGAAGLAIGLAMQGALSNVAAGIMLILFRPFKLGDFIEVDGEMGTVKEITLNNTVIASLSNLKVIIPNSEVWGNTITNYSEFDTRRAEWNFGVGYGANLATAEQVIRDTIMSDSRSHAEPEPFIQVNNLNSSSVDFLVRVWVDAAEYFQYQADMKRRVKEALDAAGIDIPFPTRTLVQASSDASQQAAEEGDQQDSAANRNEAAA